MVINPSYGLGTYSGWKKNDAIVGPKVPHQPEIRWLDKKWYYCALPIDKRVKNFSKILAITTASVTRSEPGWCCWGRGGRVLLMSCMALRTAVVFMTIPGRPSHPYNAGMEHVGFSPTGGRHVLAPSARRLEVFGESHERWRAKQNPAINRLWGGLSCIYGWPRRMNWFVF